MKDYRVRITKEALRDMEDIYNYIASALQAPENAMRQYNRLADAVESLKEMPDRFRLFDVEPWRSRGMHRMNVDNYSVFYFIRAEDVTVTDVLCAASDIEKRLRGSNTGSSLLQ